MPYTIGNIFKNSLQEIWANHEAAQVRQSVADGDFTYCSWACPKLQNLKSRPDKLPQVHNFPKVIKLDLDLSCNLKCASCREHVIIEKNSEKIQKQIELFEEIRQWALNHPSKSFTIIPGASGEIFASHSGLKFLESLVNYPHHNLKIQITSNGTLITKNLKTLEKIHHLLNRVEVSIDAATAATYTTVRGGDWSALISGLDFFHGIKKPLVFKYVVQKNNWHEIVAFAGVERYIDTPVKRYSSGMYVRLAFAVAAHLDPDILILGINSLSLMIAISTLLFFNLVIFFDTSVDDNIVSKENPLSVLAGGPTNTSSPPLLMYNC
jgi:MoaA/NifB/PqqE/SkfB family radical SAM enzyme